MILRGTNGMRQKAVAARGILENMLLPECLVPPKGGWNNVNLRYPILCLGWHNFLYPSAKCGIITLLYDVRGRRSVVDRITSAHVYIYHTQTDPRAIRVSPNLCITPA